MEDMLHYDPAKRPTASECLQYPFFHVKVPIPVNAPGAQEMVVSEEADRILDDLDDIDVGEPDLKQLSMKKEQSMRFRNEQRHHQSMLRSEEKNQKQKLNK